MTRDRLQYHSPPLFIFVIPTTCLFMDSRTSGMKKIKTISLRKWNRRRPALLASFILGPWGFYFDAYRFSHLKRFHQKILGSNLYLWILSISIEQGFHIIDIGGRRSKVFSLLSRIRAVAWFFPSNCRGEWSLNLSDEKHQTQLLRAALGMKTLAKCE